MSVVSNGIALSYGSKGSGVIYNLYADKLLQTNLIGDSVCALHIYWIPRSNTHIFCQRSMTCRPVSIEARFVGETISSNLTI